MLVLLSSLLTLFIGVFQILAEPLILSMADARTLGIAETICASGMLVSSLYLGIRGIKAGYVRILSLSLALAGGCIIGFEKLEKMTVLEALFSVKTPDKKAENRQYALIGLVVAACSVLALIPQNLCSTMSAPEFVTYMGIGDAQIRMDVRQSDHIRDMTEQLVARLSSDPEVTKYAALQTIFFFLPFRQTRKGKVRERQGMNYWKRQCI